MKHPEMCYVYIASTNEIGVVKWGESGYYKTDITPPDKPDEFIKRVNNNLGISDKEAEVMSICSMANPKDWDTHYEMVLSHMN